LFFKKLLSEEKKQNKVLEKFCLKNQKLKNKKLIYKG